MNQILTLHCGIDNCNKHYEYKFANDTIIAISAQWRNEESKGGSWDGLLPEQPNVGESYELFINFPLKIDLTQNFWVTYFDPYTEQEGLETEQGINSLLFCLCESKNIIEVENRFARIDIKVIKVQPIEDYKNTHIEIGNRIELLEKEIDSKHVTIENFDRYCIIKENYESDCGWIYIIEKNESGNVIVAENRWDFHQNIWQSTNEALTFELGKKIGI